MNSKRLDDELPQMIGSTGVKVPGLGVIIYKGGSEVYSNFLGSRTIDNQNPADNKPVTRDTRFRVASVSKMFTMFTIMQLMERDILDLDEDVSNYLNFSLRNPAYAEQKITIRMLASHTSSICDDKIYSIPSELSIEEFFSPAGKFYLNGAHFLPNQPGKFFQYSNLNYGVLGTIVENVTGKRFDIYQRENILSQLDTNADYVPANLDPSAFEMLGTVYQKKNRSGVWNEFGDWFSKADDFKNIKPIRDSISLQNPYDENFQMTCDLSDYKIGTNATIFSPQGGLRISFDELAHVLELLLNNGFYNDHRILSESSIQMMCKPQWIYDSILNNGDNYDGSILNYGLGLYSIDVNSNNHEINLLGHTGVAFGMLSGLFFDPKNKNGFVYMINGTAIDEDNDPRSKGIFSSNYIWEETLMNLICTSFDF